jgi:hypothetical protein
VKRYRPLCQVEGAVHYRGAQRQPAWWSSCEQHRGNRRPRPMPTGNASLRISQRAGARPIASSPDGIGSQWVRRPLPSQFRRSDLSFLIDVPSTEKNHASLLGSTLPETALDWNDGHESRRYLTSHAMALRRRRDPQQGKCYRRKLPHIERFHQQKALGFKQREVGR